MQTWINTGVWHRFEESAESGWSGIFNPEFILLTIFAFFISEKCVKHWWFQHKEVFVHFEFFVANRQSHVTFIVEQWQNWP